MLERVVLSSALLLHTGKKIIDLLRIMRYLFGYKGNGGKAPGVTAGQGMDELAYLFGDTQQHLSDEDCKTQHRILMAIFRAVAKLH